MEHEKDPNAAAIGLGSGPDHAAIRRLRGRTLANPEFHATDRVRELLRFVVAGELAGRGHRLKGCTVAAQGCSPASSSFVAAALPSTSDGGIP